MIIYAANIIILIITYFIYREAVVRKSKRTDSLIIKNGSKILSQNVGGIDGVIAPLLFIAFLSMWLVMTLRGINVGYDTDGYYLGFLRIQSISWRQVFDFSQKDLVFNYERGYIILSKIFTIVSNNFTIYLGFLSALILIPVYLTIKKYSPDPFLSLVLFITLGFYHFDMSGIRQGIAISIVLYSYDLLNNKKYIKLLLLLLIASTIHSSVLFFTVSILLVNFRLSKLKIIIYYCIMVFIFLFRVPIYNNVIVLMSEESKVAGNTGAYTLFLVTTVAFTAALVFYKSTIKLNENNIALIYNICAVGVALMIFNTISYWSLRVTNYFYVFFILLIPLVVASIKDKKLQFIYKMIILYFVLTYYFTSGYKYLGTGDYTFFWQ